MIMQEEVWGVAAQLVGLGLGVLLLVSLGILPHPAIIDLSTFAKYVMLWSVEVPSVWIVEHVSDQLACQ